MYGRVWLATQSSGSRSAGSPLSTDRRCPPHASLVFPALSTGRERQGTLHWKSPLRPSTHSSSMLRVTALGPLWKTPCCRRAAALSRIPTAPSSTPAPNRRLSPGVCTLGSANGLREGAVACCRKSCPCRLRQAATGCSHAARHLSPAQTATPTANPSSSFGVPSFVRPACNCCRLPLRCPFAACFRTHNQPFTPPSSFISPVFMPCLNRPVLRLTRTSILLTAFVMSDPRESPRSALCPGM